MIPRGLTRLPLPVLERVLKLVHRGTLACPMAPTELARLGLQDATDDLSLIRGLDRPGVHAVLVAVIAERRAVEISRRASARDPAPA